jgi:hypothetical protein
MRANVYYNERPQYYFNEKNKQKDLQNILKKCQITKCNEQAINQKAIDKAKAANKSLRPISNYPLTKCVVNTCKDELINYIRSEFKNSLLIMKYRHGKLDLDEKQINLKKEIKKLLNKKEKTFQDIAKIVELKREFYVYSGKRNNK